MMIQNNHIYKYKQMKCIYILVFLFIYVVVALLDYFCFPFSNAKLPSTCQYLNGIWNGGGTCWHAEIFLCQNVSTENQDFSFYRLSFHSTPCIISIMSYNPGYNIIYLLVPYVCYDCLEYVHSFIRQFLT